MTGIAHHAVAFEFRGVTLYWYGLAYLISFIWVGWQSKRLLGSRIIWGSHEAPLLPHSVPVLVASLALGVVGGARVGFVVESIGSGFSIASAITAGGMSSFGAFAGASMALAAFCWFNHSPLRSTLDLVAISAPGCILLIRLANLANGDFIGIPVKSAWAIRLVGNAQLHPVALYEAVGEGLLPLLVLRLCVTRFGWLRRPGAVTGLFVLFYAVVRGAMIGFRDVRPGNAPLWQGVDIICCTALAITASIILCLAWTRTSKQTSRAERRIRTCTRPG